ncbi:hypothetical protein F4778DRAFT_705397 [Xylariomycetidae sp. FL2044]|nr:hypothetical protein F4778DRAFT_705397 [Xylariomycetidae sp. FL2044]
MSESLDPAANNDSDDRGPGLQAYVIVMVVITISAIVLRFVSRGIVSQANKYQRRFWYDDWLALAATPFILGSLSLAFVLIQHGLGRHSRTLDGEDLEMIGKLVFIGNLVYYASLYLTKASALLFFSRVFPKRQANKWFNIVLWTTHALNTSWILGAIFGTLFICKPIENNWIGVSMSVCNPCAAWRGSAISSAAIDLIILLLPLPMIWGLHTSNGRKTGMTAVFALGYCVIAVSLGRTIFVITTGDSFAQDMSYGSVTILYWQCSEAPISLLGICLPAMLALGRRIYGSYVAPLASKLSGSSSSHESGGTKDRTNGDYTELGYVNHHTGFGGEKGLDVRQSGDVESIPSVDSRCQMIQDMSGLRYPFTARVCGGVARNSVHGQVPDQTIRVDSAITIRRQR